MVGRQNDLWMDQTATAETGIVSYANERHCPREFTESSLVLWENPISYIYSLSSKKFLPPQIYRISCQLKVQSSYIPNATTTRCLWTARHRGGIHWLVPPLRVQTTYVQHVLTLVRIESDVDDSESVQLAIRAHCVRVGIAQKVRHTSASLALIGGHYLWRRRWLNRRRKEARQSGIN